MQALEEANMGWDDIDAIAVTYGPGLVGALLVGVAEAKALAYSLHKPLLGVHHMKGHIAANYITNKEWEPPFLCLVVSGGHTHIVMVDDYQNYRILGKTRDDAAGEAFDKVSRAIGLGYPGGPQIQKAAEKGNPEAIHFPRPCLEEEGYSFSFSGLKSAVLNYLNQQEMKGEAIVPEDVAASFQAAVVEVLYSFTTSSTLWWYVIVSVYCGLYSAGLNLVYANLFYINLPKGDQDVYYLFWNFGANILAFCGATFGTFFLSICQQFEPVSIFGLPFYGSQFLPWVRFVLTSLMCVYIWKITPLTQPDEDE